MHVDCLVDITSKYLGVPAETHLLNQEMAIVAATCSLGEVRYVFSTGLASVALQSTMKRTRSDQRYPLITRDLFTSLVMSVTFFAY